jgi:hypothetical protein
LTTTPPSASNGLMPRAPLLEKEGNGLLTTPELSSVCRNLRRRCARGNEPVIDFEIVPQAITRNLLFKAAK